jgi:Na+-driven multidrug efflux pump
VSTSKSSVGTAFHIIFGGGILLFLLAMPLIAVFPNSPEWAWDFAKLSMLFFNSIALIVVFDGITRNAELAPLSGILGFTSLLCLGGLFLHYLFPHVHFGRLYWQVCDIQCVVAPVAAMIIAKNSPEK